MEELRAHTGLLLRVIIMKNLASPTLDFGATDEN